MKIQSFKNASLALAAGMILTLLGCGQKAPEAPAAAAAGAATASTAAAGTWSPERLEELAAPVALYPDAILGHVLTASTSPQEVLDAGNWLLENQKLSGKTLDQAASKLGMSTSMRALLQFPETVDMMCMNIEWTTELGQAFTADQGAVLAAVQRLRAQAQDVGNLKTAGPLKVETEKQGDQNVIVVVPSDPKVVYVPQYDPVAVYAPPPAVIPPPTTVAAAPATTTTATAAPVQEGHSTGTLVMTGLLAFGAGMLVNEVFDDDDDYYRYGPNYGYGGMYHGGQPYYPPPPGMYRPPYGGGYYPAHGYTRPPNYQHGFNNNTIIVNNQGNNYWNQNRAPNASTLPARSPITAANPNRPKVANPKRDPVKPDWKGQQGYAGARPENKASRDKMVQNGARPGTPTAAQRPQGSYAGARPESQATRDNMAQNANRAVTRDAPASHQQGGYAGAKDRPGATPNNRPATPQVATRNPTAPKAHPSGATDRGRDAAPARTQAGVDQARTAQARPEQPARQAQDWAAPARPQASNRDAFSGGGNAASERTASERGRASVASSNRSAGGKKVRR